MLTKIPTAGAEVVIMNQTLSGKPVREGIAELIKCVNPDYGQFPDHFTQLWIVHFLDDPPYETCTRQIAIRKINGCC